MTRHTVRSILSLTALAALAACGGGGGGGGGGFPIVLPPPQTPPPQTNTAPVASAGSAQQAHTGDTVTLDGSASSDADGNALSFSWVLTSVPTGSLASLANADQAQATFVPDMAGDYVATLTVNDGTVNSAPATVTVTVDPQQVVAFDSLPSPFPPNMPSVGFEAYALTSLGDTVSLATGTPRALQSVTVAMSSWACESGQWNLGTCSTTEGASFTHPITINFYDTNDQLIGTKTQTFTVPYRPSADATCPDVKQWKAADGNCYNGYAFQIDFDLDSLALTLPDTFSYDIVYNTRTHGPAPLGTLGGYDSLNIGLYEETVAPSVGTQPTPGYVRWNGSPDHLQYNIMAKVVVRTP